jgi:lipoprotein-anchoring transpeptidase ErfK/SrfK
MKKKQKIAKRTTIRWGILVLVALGIIVVTVALYMLVFRVDGSTSYCANSITCANNLTGEFEPGKTSMFMGHTVSLPPSLAMIQTPPRRVLGDTTEKKHIYVDLSTQTLTAYEGKNVVMTYPVATGKWNRTPTGDFYIWVKLRYTRMSGGDPADGTYYNLYNVPYTMFFYNDETPKSLGFSVHGAYWHNNFGHPMSHGCVNMRPEDAGKLFEWADPVSSDKITYASQEHPGTMVTITGATPEE